MPAELSRRQASRGHSGTGVPPVRTETDKPVNEYSAAAIGSFPAPEEKQSQNPRFSVSIPKGLYPSARKSFWWSAPVPGRSNVTRQPVNEYSAAQLEACCARGKTVSKPKVQGFNPKGIVSLSPKEFWRSAPVLGRSNVTNQAAPKCHAACISKPATAELRTRPSALRDHRHFQQFGTLPWLALA
jgi:hypothetical protein